MAELVASLASDRGAFASGSDYILDGGTKPTVLRLPGCTAMGWPVIQAQPQIDGGTPVRLADVH